MKGPTAISWSTDPVAVAKAAVDFAKTNEKFVLIGGALGTQLLDVAGVKALAELPSLDALRAKLLGLLAAPATRIAGVLQAPAGQLARVFAAYADASKSEAA
jgi:large subunit ribosomal protein L10